MIGRIYKKWDRRANGTCFLEGVVLSKGILQIVHDNEVESVSVLTLRKNAPGEEPMSTIFTHVVAYGSYKPTGEFLAENILPLPIYTGMPSLIEDVYIDEEGVPCVVVLLKDNEVIEKSVPTPGNIKHLETNLKKPIYLNGREIKKVEISCFGYNKMYSKSFVGKFREKEDGTGILSEANQITNM